MQTGTSLKQPPNDNHDKSLTNVIRSNSSHHKNRQRIQRSKVLDPKNHREDKPRDRNTEENLKQSHECQEPRIGINAEPEEDECKAENGEGTILGDNAENFVADDGGHEIVGVDGGVGVLLGLFVHIGEIVCLDESVRGV